MGDFPWNIGRRNCLFLHLHQRLTGNAIQQDQLSHFAGLYQCLNGLPIQGKIHKGRRTGQIIVPYIMGYCLVVPLPLTGAGIQCKDGIGKQVFSQPVSAIKIVGRRSGGYIHPSPFLIQAHTAPVIGAPIVFILHPSPGIVAVFPFLWNGMEYPLECPGLGGIGPDMTRRGIISLPSGRSDDQQILVNNSGSI